MDRLAYTSRSSSGLLAPQNAARRAANRRAMRVMFEASRRMGGAS